MCRLFSCIPIFRGGGGGRVSLKSVKKCVSVLVLKTALLLVKNLCFGLKKRYKQILALGSPKHTALMT